MKKYSITLLLLLVSASLGFGQSPKAALYPSSSDVYVGYIATFPDYGTQFNSYRFDGGEVAYTKKLSSRWAIVGSGTAVFGSTYHVREFSGTAGVKYDLLTGRFRPYATTQIGFAYQSSHDMYGADHHPPLKPNTTDIEDGLTYRAGVGADLQMSPRVYWRLIQWDIQPQPWARHTPLYTNFSSGIGYRF